MFIRPFSSSQYKSVDDYLSQDSFISLNTVLKVVIVVGLVMLTIASLVLAGQFLRPLAGFAQALSFMATPWWSGVAMGGSFILIALGGLCLYLRQQKAIRKLKDYFNREHKDPPDPQYFVKRVKYERKKEKITQLNKDHKTAIRHIQTGLKILYPEGVLPSGLPINDGSDSSN